MCKISLTYEQAKDGKVCQICGNLATIGRELKSLHTILNLKLFCHEECHHKISAESTEPIHGLYKVPYHFSRNPNLTELCLICDEKLLGGDIVYSNGDSQAHRGCVGGKLDYGKEHAHTRCLEESRKKGFEMMVEAKKEASRFELEEKLKEISTVDVNNLICGICDKKIVPTEKYYHRRSSGKFEHKSCIQTVRICNACREPIINAEVPTVINKGTGFIHESCLGFYNQEVTERNRMKKELPFGFVGTPCKSNISSPCLICEKPIAAEVHLTYTNGVRQAHKWCVEHYDLALRYNSGKPQLKYILHYPRTIELLSRVLEGGAAKYEEMNWKKGGNTDDSYIDAAMRHLTAFVNGSTFNEDYGTHHLGHAIWNLMTMFELNGHEIMDKEKFDKVIKELTDAKSRTATET